MELTREGMGAMETGSGMSSAFHLPVSAHSSAGSVQIISNSEQF
jgi:hypothetical protein